MTLGIGFNSTPNILALYYDGSVRIMGYTWRITFHDMYLLWFSHTGNFSW